MFEDDYDDGGDANSTLVLKASASANSQGETGTISYPVNVYVFNSSNKCAAVTTLTDESSTISVELPEGSYHVYAIAGANAADYDLPTQENASPESVITLNDSKSHGDIMTANNAITLVSGGENTLALELERKVMLMQSITLNNVPDDVETVTVKISPLYTGIQLDGTLTGADGVQTISLTKTSQDGQQWAYTQGAYMLPATGEATVEVVMAWSGTDKTSTFIAGTTSDLVANCKINITGNYKSNTVILTGTITGAIWDETKNIDFTDGTTVTPTEPETDDTTTDTPSGDAPSAGEAYMGCYVLKSERSGNNTVVTLMSPKYNDEWTFTKGDTESITTDVNSKITTLSVDGITGWRLPTLEEIMYAYKNVDEINNNIDKLTGISKFMINNYYLYTDENGNIKAYKYVGENEEYYYITTEIPSASTTMLFLFTTVTFPDSSN